MAPLPSDLRSQLEKTVITARSQAESAARATLTTLAVERNEPFTTMNEAQRRLRRGLRVKARQLGEGDMIAGILLLIHEIAYEQWHRMLFARFLAETHLLMHPEGVPVTLQDCAELAREEGAADGWELAVRYASQMLPGIFLADDPAVAVRFAPEHRHALEQLVQGLPTPVFTADDSLGWVYQFWQSKKKDEVNASGGKINSTTIGPVTQLFTEDYMVKFLLHNSLGAWWAARYPESPLLQELTYLRWVDDDHEERRSLAPDATTTNPRARTPAAGTFPGWPVRVADVTMLDPCGGSGHFVLAGFDLLTQMRIEEEGLDAEAAVRAVICDNLFMLDIDPRCCQLATFNLLLAAWKRIGYRADLPVPNIACSGIAVEGQLVDWLKLAEDNVRLRTALERLHNLFRNASILGSLINPADLPIQDHLFSTDYHEVVPLLEKALKQEKHQGDQASAVMGEAALGVLRATKLLVGHYTLVATNVPYLLRGKQKDFLQEYCDNNYEDSSADLATVFIERCRDYCKTDGTFVLVTPQNWLFLYSYAELRKKLFLSQSWDHITTLGSGATAKASWEKIRALSIITNSVPNSEKITTGIHAPFPDDVGKANWLKNGDLLVINQAQQLHNPDATLSLQNIDNGTRLSRYADSLQGIASGDYARFGRFFWEIALPATEWALQQSTISHINHYSGRENIILWENGKGILSRSDSARVQGHPAWKRLGIAITQTRNLPCTLYTGELFDNNTAIVVPKEPRYLPAIWCYCSSLQFNKEVRKIDQKIGVTNSKLIKVPFDLDYWNKIAQEKYPNGLPEPYSNDPTQWLFTGHPAGSTDPLQVAVARLLGYRWPQQQSDPLDMDANSDGIVCLPPVYGEAPAHERLRALLAAAYNQPPVLPNPSVYNLQSPDLPFTTLQQGWNLATQQRLLAAVGYAGKSLEEWLRDGFFEQHCRRFQNRPFIWHIWDGRKDGFGALVNYHKLNAPTLNKLIYTYLGAWISAQRVAVERGEAGADGRLVAALALQKKLELIWAGEAYDCDKDGKNCKSGYDIYVRWKSLHQQPTGWDPDLNDGIRLNSRPWVTAGVLRKKFTINWGADRGKNPDGSERMNDLHFSQAQKEAARQKVRETL